jgi:hypothetical protein
LVEIESYKHFLLVWPWTVVLLIPSSQVYGIMGMNHQHLARIIVWGQPWQKVSKIPSQKIS